MKYLNSRPLYEARYNNQRRLFTKQQSVGSVLLKLPLFTGGRIINEIQAAELFRLAEENRLSRTRDELIFNVSSTFYAILSQEKVIDSVRFSLEAMQEQRRKMAKMVEVAKAARVDLLRTEVRVADLEQSLERETNVLEIQKRLLANLMGLDFEKAQMKFAGNLTFEKTSYRPAATGAQGPGAAPRFPGGQGAGGKPGPAGGRGPGRALSQCQPGGGLWLSGHRRIGSI